MFSPSFRVKSQLGKNTLIGTGVRNIDMERVASKTGCKVGKLPFVYLGTPIGAHMNKANGWKILLDKFAKKLGTWKMKLLSVGGRLTLCKSVLGGLGTYLFSLFKAPSKVLSKHERIRRNFFWGTCEGGRKIGWVAWDKILNSLENGGLGIGSLKAQNLALLAKWWWRFKVENGVLWKRVITSIHGPSGKLGEGTSKGIWGNIAKVNKDIEADNISLPCLFVRKLGNGKDTKFWTDTWCGSETLAARFPDLRQWMVTGAVPSRIEWRPRVMLRLLNGDGVGRSRGIVRATSWRNWRVFARCSIWVIMTISGCGDLSPRDLSRLGLFAWQLTTGGLKKRAWLHDGIRSSRGRFVFITGERGWIDYQRVTIFEKKKLISALTCAVCAKEVSRPKTTCLLLARRRWR